MSSLETIDDMEGFNVYEISTEVFDRLVAGMDAFLNNFGCDVVRDDEHGVISVVEPFYIGDRKVPQINPREGNSPYIPGKKLVQVYSREEGCFLMIVLRGTGRFRFDTEWYMKDHILNDNSLRSSFSDNDEDGCDVSFYCFRKS